MAPSHCQSTFVLHWREGEQGVVGELEVADAGTAAADPALLEGDDGGRVGASPSVKAPGRCATA